MSNVWQQVVEENGRNDPERLKEVIKKRKLKFFGHQIRRGRKTKVLIQGNVDGIRQRGRPKKNWADNLKECSKHSFSELSRRAEDRKG